MTKNLNAFQNFQAGFSIADAIEQRNFQREQYEYKKQQEQAKQALAVEAFNNPEALKQVYGRDRELGESIAKERDKFNRVSSMAISDVLNSRPEQKQQVWNSSRAFLQSRGIDISDLPEKYSPETEAFLRGKQKELRTWDDTFKTIETDRGLQLQSEKTGEITPTGYGVYVKPPSTVVNVNNAGETELYKKARGAQGEIYGDYIKQGNKANESIASLNRAEQLIDKIGTTGKITPLAAELGNVLNQFGAKVDTSKIANIEDLTQLAQTQVGQILSSGEYGSGTGISATDLSAAGKRVYGADKTPQGNKQIIQTLKALQTRKREVGRITSRLINQGKADQIDEAIDKLGPVFPESDNSGKSNAPKAGTVESGYIFLGGDPSKQENWRKQ